MWRRIAYCSIHSLLLEYWRSNYLPNPKVYDLTLRSNRTTVSLRRCYNRALLQVDDVSSWLSGYFSDICTLALENSTVSPRNAEANEYFELLLDGGLATLTAGVIGKDVIDRLKTLTRLLQYDVDIIEVVADQTFYILCAIGEHILESLIRGRIRQDLYTKGSPIRKALMANS